MDVMALASAERADLATLLTELTPAQWDAPTPCSEWRVRDVAAHVVSYEGLGAAALAQRFVKGRLMFDRVNEVGVAEQSTRSSEDLIALVRSHVVPHGITARFGGRVALTDALIHHQDIRRPLGLPREVPLERLRAVLPFALTAPPIRGLWHIRGVRVVATDLDWAAGRGPEARGTGEAVLMTIAGRRGVAQELSGPGRDRLVQRLG